jgi:two-component system LytT family response regulator
MTTAAATPALRVVVVDDEPLARADLAQLLGGRHDVSVVGVCGSGAEALAAARALRPDVLLLDIRMPGLDGFHVVSRLDPASMPYVIFVTAFDRYAVEAFRVRALDYLLKPVQASRLNEALARAREQLRMRAALGWAASLHNAAREQSDHAGAVEESSGQYWSEIIVRVGARDVIIRVNDITWIEAETYYVRLHVGPRSYLYRERMHVLEANLDPRRFVRVHRSAIVNVNHVQEIRHDERGKHFVMLSTGRLVRTSRPRWLGFRSAMRSRSRPDLA